MGENSRLQEIAQTKIDLAKPRADIASIDDRLGMIGQSLQANISRITFLEERKQHLANSKTDFAVENDDQRRNKLQEQKLLAKQKMVARDAKVARDYLKTVDKAAGQPVMEAKRPTLEGIIENSRIEKPKLQLQVEAIDRRLAPRAERIERLLGVVDAQITRVRGDQEADLFHLEEKLRTLQEIRGSLVQQRDGMEEEISEAETDDISLAAHQAQEQSSALKDTTEQALKKIGDRLDSKKLQKMAVVIEYFAKDVNNGEEVPIIVSDLEAMVSILPQAEELVVALKEMQKIVGDREQQSKQSTKENTVNIEDITALADKQRSRVKSVYNRLIAMVDRILEKETVYRSGTEQPEA